MQVVDKSLKYPTFCEEGDKKLVIATLQTLHRIWRAFGNMAHLFLATCMLCSDKTSASFAAEIWLNGAPKGTVDSKLIGEIIGVHQRAEFAPIKRFTDLIMGQMFQVSKQHNIELEKLLTSLLHTLPDEPIKNLKKLLEIYAEILSVNNSLIHHEILKQQLLKWKATAGLNKVIERLEQMVSEGELVD